MPSSSKLFEQVEHALSDARILDRDMVRDLLDLAKALEYALLETCRGSVEVQAMDKSVAEATQQLRGALDALDKAYSGVVSVEPKEVEQAFEAQLNVGRYHVTKL